MADRELLDDTATCTFCPKMCRHACPVGAATGRESLVPQAKMEALGGLLREHLSWTEQNAAPLWGCTGCGHCTEYCDHDVKPGISLLEGRQKAAAQGASPVALQGYRERFLGRSHRLAQQLAAREGTVAEARVAYWPGCDAIDKGDATIAAFEALAAERGSPIKTLAIGEACAGYPLLAAGLVDEFRWHAGRVGEALRGIETLVVHCSACLHTLRKDYKAAGVTLPVDIVSIAEYLMRYASPAPTEEAKPTIYYHDPCYHARYNRLTAEPRALLGEVATVREFAWHGADADCCGGAGLLPKTMPDAADAMAKRRLEEVARAGGGTVVTSCATCTFQLRRNAPPGVTVLDLPDALHGLRRRAPNP